MQAQVYTNTHACTQAHTTQRHRCECTSIHVHTSTHRHMHIHTEKCTYMHTLTTKVISSRKTGAGGAALPNEKCIPALECGHDAGIRPDTCQGNRADSLLFGKGWVFLTQRLKTCTGQSSPFSNGAGKPGVSGHHAAIPPVGPTTLQPLPLFQGSLRHLLH